MSIGGRAKCVTPTQSKPNARFIKLKGNTEHVTIMSVVSGSGQIFTPVCVLPGKEARFRRTGAGRYETPSQYLTFPHYLYTRPVSGVDSIIFLIGNQNLSVRLFT